MCVSDAWLNERCRLIKLIKQRSLNAARSHARPWLPAGTQWGGRGAGRGAGGVSRRRHGEGAWPEGWAWPKGAAQRLVEGAANGEAARGV